MEKVVFILADKRSGSTLLDQLLGAHPRIDSLGEVRQLRAYALQDRTEYDPAHPLDCSCGKRIEACEFWTTTQKRCKPFASLKLTVKSNRLYRKHPSLFPSFLYRDVARDSMALYEATGCDYVIDSSKDIFRFRAVYDYAPDKVIPLVLLRDYRAVAHSKQKRGHSLENGVTGWTCAMRQIHALTDDIPGTIRVRYEDLCKDPRREIDKILWNLDLPFSEDCLTRPEVSHHIGGSPSKLDPSKRQISCDDSYLTAFTESELATMKVIAGPLADRFGYP